MLICVIINTCYRINIAHPEKELPSEPIVSNEMHLYFLSTNECSEVIWPNTSKLSMGSNQFLLQDSIITTFKPANTFYNFL